MPVESENQIKGYEVAKGEYVQIEDDEIKTVQLESNHTIDIERFVPRASVDELYLDTPYYLAPTDRVGEEAFAVIRDAMRAEKMVGLARVVLFRRERIVMLEPRDKGIVATSLHYANEVHAASGYFDEIPDTELPKQMLELATHIIAKMTGKFKPEEFEDRYENALIELIRSKQQGMPVKPQPTHRQTNVINLMDALKRSVEGAKGETERAPSKKQSAEKPAGQGPCNARQGQGAQGRVAPGAHAELHRPPSVPPEAQLHAHQGAARRAQEAQHRRSVRGAQARGAPAALRSAPRARRCPQKLGGHQGPEPVARPTSASPCAPRTTRSTTPSSRAASPRANTAPAASSSGTADAGRPRAIRTSSSPRGT